MPLVNKNCVEASPREQKRQRAKVVPSANVHLESTYALSVNNLLDAEAEFELSSKAVETLTQSTADRLPIYQFIEGWWRGRVPRLDAASWDLGREFCPRQAVVGSSAGFAVASGSLVLCVSGDADSFVMNCEKEKTERNKGREKKKQNIVNKKEEPKREKEKKKGKPEGLMYEALCFSWRFGDACSM